MARFYDASNADALESDSDPSSLVERFLFLTHLYCDFGVQAGVEIVAYHDANRLLFCERAVADQKLILTALGHCVRICQGTLAAGHSLNDTPAISWAALREFGFRPPSDLFGHIGNLDIVEIHSAEGMQLFRNFNFYRYCSYSLDELFCGSWLDLYERDESVTGLILAFADKVFRGGLASTVKLEAPPHRVREMRSELRLQIDLQMKWGAPLFLEGTRLPGATMVVESAEFAESSLERSLRRSRVRPPQPNLSLF